MSQTITPPADPAARLLRLGVLAAAEDAEVAVPVPGTVEELTAEPYAGMDPVTELAARLADTTGTDHTAAFDRLARQVSPAQAYAVVAAASSDQWRRQFERLVTAGILPVDDSLFALFATGTGYDRAVADAAVRAVFHHRTAPVQLSARALVTFGIHAGWAAGDLLTAAIRPQSLPDTVVDELVGHFAGFTLADAVAVAERSRRVATLTADQVLRLVADGSVPALLVAACLAPGNTEAADVLAATPLAAPLLTACWYESGEQKQVVAAAVADANPEILAHLGADAARYAIRRCPEVNNLPDDVFARLLLNSNLLTDWFARRLPAPVTAGRVAALATLTDPTPHWVLQAVVSSYADTDWCADLAASTPDVAAEFRTELLEHGRRVATGRGGDWSHRLRVAGIVTVLDRLFESDPRLWDRFVSAGAPESPFLRPGATIGNAVEVYRSRWTAAERRTGRRRGR